MNGYPVEPMGYAEAVAYVENFLGEIALSDEARADGYVCTIYDYFDGEPAKLAGRPWVGIRVAEVAFHKPRSGASYMQVDVPWGIAVCAQVERCLLALIEGWDNETAEEFERLAFLFDLDRQEAQT